MTKSSLREQWRESILADFPKLAEIPSVVDTMLDYYEANPDGFKEMMKEEQKKERKQKKKEEPKEEQPYDPSKFVITCISKEVVEGVVVEELKADDIINVESS